MNGTQKDDSTYWDKQAAGYDRAIQILNPTFFREIPRLVQPQINESSRVLEVAAGTGLITRALIGAKEIVATDFSEAMLKICQGRLSNLAENKLRTLRADVYALPFEANSFDVVVCGNLLHLLDRPNQALQEIRRVLKPGGTLIAPTFCHGDNLVALAASHLLSLFGFPVITRFKKKELLELVGNAGFSIEKTDALPGILPLLWTVSSSKNSAQA